MFLLGSVLKIALILAFASAFVGRVVICASLKHR